ncbi:hypothetical protein B0T24DRAFT_598164 [Lasiosphaeria ovina]|uniref:Uncharacterized protein n=1 Tax=Lasiosphaeria ovina TaxID=92902 RepID=A0AAE0JUY3_9PEZI|nr:hypothetical protein B0T24DRAFT_598164 [Lasiosphaeria ovina]
MCSIQSTRVNMQHIFLTAVFDIFICIYITTRWSTSSFTGRYKAPGQVVARLGSAHYYDEPVRVHLKEARALRCEEVSVKQQVKSFLTLSEEPKTAKSTKAQRGRALKPPNLRGGNADEDQAPLNPAQVQADVDADAVWINLCKGNARAIQICKSFLQIHVEKSKCMRVVLGLEEEVEG